MAPRHPRSALVALAVTLTVLLGAAGSALPARARSAEPSGFRALSGAAAAKFDLPPDVRRTRSFHLPRLGLTVERYQQFATPDRAAVDGGQLTLYRRGGQTVLVVGAHYPGVRATNRVAVDAGRALARAAADDRLDEGDAEHPVRLADAHDLRQSAGLLIDPRTGRLFYRIETAALGFRQFHSVDAETGAVFDAVDALAHHHGIGVKSDTKSLAGATGTADDLTRNAGGAWRMSSSDGRLVTLDAANRWGGSFPMAADADDHWTAAGQRAAVDAQYFARATDTFLVRRFGFDLLAACDYGQVRSVVRYGQGYANAFWDGRYLVYGDGDGSQFRQLSGAQDVVSHEFVHAVTECTSGLLYEGEPGALNEAFSDIMAVATEFALAEPLTSNCRRAHGQAECADWWIGEDSWVGGGPLGIRSLVNPAAGEQPSHYGARYTGPMDNGGVHINSGIASHAFYLLARGGRNAHCAAASGPDCDVVVPGIGLAAAEAMTFVAYVGLSADADFCAARAATIAAAEALYPASTGHAVAADLSWAAVGLGDTTCVPTRADFAVSLDRRSASLAPGGPARSLNVSLIRGSEAGTIEFSAAGLPRDWYQLAPVSSVKPGESDGTTMSISVPSGAAGGRYPLLVRVSSASRTALLAAVVVVDAAPPTVSQPAGGLVPGSVVELDGRLPVAVTWSAADPLSGLAGTRLEVSVNGGPWTAATAQSMAAGRATVLVNGGSQRFRVRAIDGAGNEAVSAASAPLSVAGFQEGAARYSSGWSSLSPSQTWGSMRYSRTRGRKAIFRFTGREVAWVTQTGPKRGRARVYVDGVLVRKVDLYSPTPSPRTVVFVARGLGPGVEHIVRIVTLAPSRRPRVDVDGFLVLNR